MYPVYTFPLEEGLYRAGFGLEYAPSGIKKALPVGKGFIVA